MDKKYKNKNIIYYLFQNCVFNTFLTLFVFAFQILGSRLEASNLDVQTGTRHPFEFHFQGAPEDSYFQINFYSEFSFTFCSKIPMAFQLYTDRIQPTGEASKVIS